MPKRTPATLWARALARNLKQLTQRSLRAGKRVAAKAVKASKTLKAAKPARLARPAKTVKAAKTPAKSRQLRPPGPGSWTSGMAVGTGGAKRFWLFRPPDVKRTERLPLMVMLHGCGQNAKGFALSTRMNTLAARERFLVLYPEQDRVANMQGCWNWFDTRSGRAYSEAELILKAIDQVCLLHPVDAQRVAIAGLSAGASMAVLLATRHPERFKAVAMHSGVAPGTAQSAATALGAMHGRRDPTPLLVSAEAMAATWPALLVIHGSRDPVVSVHNGQAAAQWWANAAGARTTARRTVQRGKRYPTTVTDFKRGKRTMATLAEVAQLGHAWSGGAARQPFSDPKGPDASRMVWTFATKQFKAV